MLTTVSFRSSCEASIFSRVSIMFLASSYQLPASSKTLVLLRALSCSLGAGSWQLLEFQPRLPRRFRHRLDPAVVEEAAAIEYDLLDALRDQPLGDRFSQRLRAGDVAAA